MTRHFHWSRLELFLNLLAGDAVPILLPNSNAFLDCFVISYILSTITAVQNCMTLIPYCDEELDSYMRYLLSFNHSSLNCEIISASN